MKGGGDGEGGKGRHEAGAGVAVAVGRGDWPGAGWRPGQVTLHRTLATGAQLGYIRDGQHFRFASRGDAVMPWEVHGVQYRSWVDIARQIDGGLGQ